MNKKNKITGNIVFSTSPNWQPEQEEEIAENLLPQKQPIKVRADKKQRAGKIVTLIEGFVMTESEMQSLEKRLKSHCGSGGSLKNRVIIIQGDHSKKILEWLHKNDFILAKKIQ